MGELLLSLLPVALAIMASPLAILAMVAVLVAPRGRRNGIAFAAGWVVGLVLVLLLGLWILSAIDDDARREAPDWIPWLRILLGLLLIGAAVFVYRRGQSHNDAMAAAATPAEVARAAPQLPGYLQAVGQFTFARTFALGVGIFALNPVDASCALIAAIDLNQSDQPTAGLVLAAGLFTVVAVLPVVIPVGVAVVRGTAAQPMIDALRDWVAGHANLLNAGLLLVIGVVQLVKGIPALG